jgi:tRNA A-37 threonylcarbamoyl transferase component Bud32
LGSPSRLTTFNLSAGDHVADKYVVVRALGRGWEGEVYLVKERGTGVERSAKLFFPQRNERDHAVRHHARKLHRLRHCPVVIQYHTRDTHRYGDLDIAVLVSEYVDGELLPEFLARQPGGRLDPFQALLLLLALARGVEDIHALGDYHGDLHVDNVFVARRGLDFVVKLVDPFPPDTSRSPAEARLGAGAGAAPCRRRRPPLRRPAAGVQGRVLRAEAQPHRAEVPDGGGTAVVPGEPGVDVAVIEVRADLMIHPNFAQRCVKFGPFCNWPGRLAVLAPPPPLI